MKNLILASTSALFGGQYLEYLKDEIAELFAGINEIVFVAYARPGGMSHDDYTAKVKEFFTQLNIAAKGLHSFENPVEALKNAKGFFTGGGNTFLLTKTLHELGLMNILKEEIEKGKPYLGTSAGSNIAGKNIRTTNDMPIVYPPSFDAMGILPFNINPHYLDPYPNLKHNGETRETRILEFLTQNDLPVVGLREGSWLRIKDETIKLEGELTARIFEKGKEPWEMKAETFLDKISEGSTFLCSIFLIVFLFAFGFSEAQNKDDRDSLLQWGFRPISAHDFTIIPDTMQTGSLVAYTTANLNYMYRIGRGEDKEVIQVKIVNSFIKKKSWMKMSFVSDSLLLKHEQGHFDIGEVFARRLIRKLDSIKFTSKYFDELKIQFDENRKNLNEMQLQYDRETNHGRNLIAQNNWNTKIKSELISLKKYSSKEGIYQIYKLFITN